jgi:ACR3 family arsenite efflux pump ArsB
MIMSGLVLLFSALVVGILVHVGVFIRGEWHLHILHILISHISIFSLTLHLIYQKKGESFVDAIQDVFVAAVAYLLGLFGSMTIYRLFFHKLANFPGPKLAAVSKLWHVWHIRRSTNYLFLQQLHKRYGKIIRTGQSESKLYHYLT